MKILMISLFLSFMMTEPKPAEPTNLKEVEAEKLICPILALTDDDDCPSTYTLATYINCSSYSWTITGSGYISGSTTGNMVTVVPQRSYLQSTTFTVSVVALNCPYGTGTVNCSRTITLGPIVGCP